MRKDLSSLGRESLVYGLSTVAGRFLVFLLTPFYTHVLRPDEYGVVAVVFTYIAFLNVLYQYGMDQAYLRYASTLEEGNLSENFSTPMWSITTTSLCFSGLVFACAAPLARLVGIAPDLSCLCRYSAGILALDALSIVPFMELRRVHRSWSFVGIRTANIAINVALNVLFLWRWHLGVRGVFLASLAASASRLALLAPTLAKLWRPVFHARLYGDLLRFALPYVPSGLASMAVQVIDRPILKALTDDATVGIYQANYRLGIFMMLVVNMFDAAWRPFFMERADKPGAKELFGRVLTYFLLAGTFILLGLSLFIGDIVRFPILGMPLIAPAYWSGLSIVPIVLAGYLFNGMYVNFMVQATWTKRTDMLMGATALGAAVNVGTNLLLIPHWGMLGAAIATLLAYAAMAAFLFFAGQRLFRIPYEYGRLSHMGLALAAIASALWAAHAALAANRPQWTMIRILALGGYPAALWLTGFFNSGELSTLRDLAGSLSGRRPRP